MLVRAVGDARRREPEEVADLRVEVHPVVRLRQVWWISCDPAVRACSRPGLHQLLERQAPAGVGAQHRRRTQGRDGGPDLDDAADDVGHPERPHLGPVNGPTRSSICNVVLCARAAA